MCYCAAAAAIISICVAVGGAVVGGVVGSIQSDKQIAAMEKAQDQQERLMNVQLRKQEKTARMQKRTKIISARKNVINRQKMMSRQIVHASRDESITNHKSKAIKIAKRLGAARNRRSHFYGSTSNSAWSRGG